MKTWKAKGFSLIEVLVALEIFGVLLGGLAMMMQQEQRLLRNSADVLQARLIANEIMERLKVRPFEKLESYSLTYSSDLTTMTVNVRVSEFDLSTLKKIEVTVEWVDWQGRERNVMLATLRSQYSLHRI